VRQRSVQGGARRHCVPRTCTTASGTSTAVTSGMGVDPRWHAEHVHENRMDCQDNLCKAGPTAGCLPLACTTAAGTSTAVPSRLGRIPLACGTACTKRVDLPGCPMQGRATAGCVPKDLYRGVRDEYCGEYWDGCGSTLTGGTRARRPGGPAKTIYARRAERRLRALAAQPRRRPVRGEIGNGCGSLSTAEPRARRRVTCQDNLCKPGRARLRAADLHHCNGDQYCGIVGRLRQLPDCGTTCLKAGWICQDGLCKAGPTWLHTLACSPTRRQYCGTIGTDRPLLACATDCSAAAAAGCAQQNACVAGLTAQERPATTPRRAAYCARS